MWIGVRAIGAAAPFTVVVAGGARGVEPLVIRGTPCVVVVSQCVWLTLPGSGSGSRSRPWTGSLQAYRYQGLSASAVAGSVTVRSTRVRTSFIFAASATSWVASNSSRSSDRRKLGSSFSSRCPACDPGERGVRTVHRVDLPGCGDQRGPVAGSGLRSPVRGPPLVRCGVLGHPVRSKGGCRAFAEPHLPCPARPASAPRGKHHQRGDPSVGRRLGGGARTRRGGRPDPVPVRRTEQAAPAPVRQGVKPSCGRA